MMEVTIPGVDETLEGLRHACCCATRLKATLERVQRLTQGYTDGLLQIFPPRVAALGKALGLEGERVQVSLERVPSPARTLPPATPGRTIGSISHHA